MIRVGKLNVSLDCREQDSDINFVSHAHSDHISGAGRGKKVLASKETIELMEIRGKHGMEHIPNLESATLINAGHVLGSKQLYAEPEELGASLLYSGDFQMQAPSVAAPIETRQTDILIIDSTYPDPSTRFPERNRVIAEISEFILSRLNDGIILFGAHSIGKAQELIRIANDTGTIPVVDKNIHFVNQVYLRHGVALDYVSFYKDEEEQAQSVLQNFMGITTMSKLHKTAALLSSLYKKKVYTAVATGFASTFNMRTHAQFVLSDHADFAQATEYIRLCSPSRIYTRGSQKSAKKFAENLSKAGFPAAPLPSSFIGNSGTNKAMQHL